jgi:regulator of replication initiation timing
MTTAVDGMRSNKPVSMDIDQIRGWATLMDRAAFASLMITILAVAALGITTWLSSRFNGAVRAYELAANDQHKGEIGRQAAQLEQDVATARQRTAALEQEVATARDRTVRLELEISAARERMTELDRQAATAREKAETLEQAASEAAERAARAVRESATASEKARAAEIDAAEIRQRVADLGRKVREAAARPADPVSVPAAETLRAAEGEGAAGTAGANPGAQVSPIVTSLKRYSGAKAAVYVLEQVPDAPAIGATISGYLGEAGWAPLTWTWTGVAGIVGVVVLVKDGSDAATNEAASSVVEGLRAAGFNATKGEWPADWRRYRGTLNGPSSPSPTDAAIRIVIGTKAR